MKNLIPQFIAEKYEMKETSGSFRGSAMSLDLKGFTRMTEELMKNGKYGAEILSDIINTIFAPTVRIIMDKGGFISAFIGDAITAVFPEKHAGEASSAADEILRLISEMKHIKAGSFSFKIEARIGLSYGSIDWETVNTAKRSVYFFKGETLYRAADAQQSADIGSYKQDASMLKIKTAAGQSLNINHPKIKLSTLKRFSPDQVLDMKTSGEFRDIVSVFVMFNENKSDLKKLSEYLCDKPIEYGGYLNKIDFGDKGGIALLIFGAPVAVEKYPERAVLFTSELVRTFEGIKAGISKGTAYCGFIGSSERSEYTAMGEVVNLSARLSAKCAEGEVLLDEKIASYGFKELSVVEKGSFSFKGFRKKIRVFSPEKKAQKLPSSSERAFVGRKDELGKILKISKNAFNKNSSILIQVNGDPGIGKSSLVSAVRHELEKDGVKWFYLQCDEILKKSLNAFAYIFQNYFGIHEENSESDNTRLLMSGLSDYKDLPDYERLVYFIGRLVGIKIENNIFDSLASRESYENILFAIRNYFIKQAEFYPVIIEIDDIHNIDPDSKEALQTLLRKSGQIPLVIISSARFNTDGSVYESGIDHTEIQNINLTSLDKDSVQSLAENVYGTEISIKLLELLLQKCSGNPFYTEQMALYLKESGLTVKKNNKTEILPGRIEIPDRISSVIISRIDKLSSEIKRLIRTASVLGKEFSIRLLAEVLKKKDISIHLNKAEQEAIWSKTTELFYIFKHALLRDTVYDMQLKKTLKELHLITAKTIESLYSNEPEKHYGDLAYHFEKAEIKPESKKYLYLAGNYSSVNYRNEEAINYYRKLYDYCHSENEQAEVLRLIGELYIRLGDWNNTESFFKKSYRKAIKSCLPLQIVKSGVSMSEYYGEIGDIKKNLSYARRMLKKAEENKFFEQINNIYINLGIIYRMMSENDKAEKCYLKALKYYRYKKDHPRIRSVYDNLGVLYMNSGDFKRSKHYYKLAEKRASDQNDNYGLMHIYNNTGMIYYYQGDLEKAIDVFSKSLELAEKLGILRHKSIVYGQFAQIYFYKNDCKTALDYSLKGYEISEEMGDTFSQCYLLSSIGVLCRKLGEPEKALEYFEKQRSLALKIGLKDIISLSCANLAFMHTLMGRFTESNCLYDEAVRISLETGEKIGLAVNYANMGENFKYLKDCTKALELYHKAIEIDRELDLKFQLVSAYYYISEVYAETGDALNTILYLDQCKKLANELNRKDYYFKADVLTNVIDRSQSEKQRTALLLKLDSEELSEDEKASLYKAIYTVSGDKQYRKKALMIYKGLYEKLKYYEYKMAIEELGV